jgi:TadE-like protein
MKRNTSSLPKGSRFKGQRGNALIQLTLSMSLLIPLFLGTWEFGYGFYLYSQLSEALRSGARYASLRTYDSATSTPSDSFTNSDPRLQRLPIRRFHNLKTAGVLGINPTGMVEHACREHPAAVLEAVANGLEVTVFGALDDHEEHS